MAEGKEATPKKRRPKKKVVKKVEEQRLQVLLRVSHKDKTYEVDEIILEKDPEMVKQLVDKGLAKKV